MVVKTLDPRIGRCHPRRRRRPRRSGRFTPDGTGNHPAGNHGDGTGFPLADLQENYETEVLLAASDHLANYSDEELVALIGF